MCGLVGFATTDAEQVISADLAVFIFNQMMKMNDVRGGDSYGFSLVRPKEKSIEHFKVIGKCGEKQDDKRHQKGLAALIDAVVEGGPVIVMGHNRKATTGEISIRNQHPFEFGKPKKGPWVLGAHNGMVWGYEEAIDLWDITRKVEVDSEVIFRGMMTDREPSEVIGTLMPIGSMALTYMRNDWSILNMFSGDNPLNVAHLPGIMFWSSEHGHLRNALFGLTAETTTLRSDKLYAIDVKTHKVLDVSTVRPIDTLLDRAYSWHGVTGNITYLKRPFKGPARRVVHPPFGSTKYVADEARKLVDLSGSTAKSSEPGKVLAKIEPKSIIKPTPDHLSLAMSEDFDNEMVFFGDLDRVTVAETTTDLDIGLATCAMCELKDPKNDETRMVAPYSLLWYEGDALCGVCYHWMVLSALMEV